MSGTNIFPRFAKDIKYLVILYRESLQTITFTEYKYRDPDLFLINLRLAKIFSPRTFTPKQRRCPHNWRVGPRAPMGCYMLNSLKSPVLSLKFCNPFHNLSNYFKFILDKLFYLIILNYWTVISNFSRKLMFKEYRSYLKSSIDSDSHIHVTKKPVQWVYHMY